MSTPADPPEWLTALYTNQRLLVTELLRRGAEVRPIEPDLEMLEVRFDGRRDYLLDRFSVVAPYAATRISADKFLTKRLLAERGVPVPPGILCTVSDRASPINWARALGAPVVVKPNWGSHGTGVQVDLRDATEIGMALDTLSTILGPNGDVVVEAMVDGAEHRVFVTATGGFAVLRRDPAAVTGDGRSTIRELADTESARRAAEKRRSGGALCPIDLDGEAKRTLARSGLSFDSVLPKGHTQTLRRSSNLARGGLSTDVTDAAAPGWRLLARRILETFPGMPLCGFDLMCADIAVAPQNTPHAVLEVNSNPGLAMHTFPAVGRPRPVAVWAADAMFPWIPNPDRA